MSEKRFQECNWLEKVWRYRFYIPIPFKYIWYMYIKPFPVLGSEFDEDKGHMVDTGVVFNPRGKNLWKLLIGIAQGPMKWYHTHEEVMKSMEKHFKDYDNGVH